MTDTQVTPMTDEEAIQYNMCGTCADCIYQKPRYDLWLKGITHG